MSKRGEAINALTTLLHVHDSTPPTHSWPSTIVDLLTEHICEEMERRQGVGTNRTSAGKTVLVVIIPNDAAEVEVRRALAKLKGTWGVSFEQVQP